MRTIVPGKDTPAGHALRRTLIAAAGWAALPAALAALCVLTAVLTSAGLLPEATKPLVLMLVLAVAVVSVIGPSTRLRGLSEYVFDRYSITDEERIRGYVIFAIASLIAAASIYLIV